MDKVLHFIGFKDLDSWDVKQYISSIIKSQYQISQLKHCIQQETTKIKPFESPNDDFKILGVNNKIGLFDNEIKKGKEINQAYKIVNDGFLAYNPYRINVGSIGLKTDEQKFNLISPAYVVLSCLDNLLPEYLFLVFKTNIFNQAIKDNTRGSVRQILAYDILEKLNIPLPPLKTQQQLVKNYQDKINLADKQEQKARDKQQEIEEYLYTELGIQHTAETPKTDNILQFIDFRDLSTWSIQDLLNKDDLKSNLYNKIKIKNIALNISTGTTPPTSEKDYFDGNIDFYTPSDLGLNKNLYNSKRKVSNKALNDKKIRLFCKDTLLFVGIGSTIGKVGIIKNDFASSNQQITGITIDTNLVNIEFMYYYLNTFKEYIIKNSYISTLPIMNQNQINSIEIIFPPLKIQNKIATHIENIKNEIKDLNHQAQQNKDTALIEFEREIFDAS
jgi:type I restriction enzyme S subunit